MKKVFLFVLLFCCFTCVTAETLKPENVNNATLQKMISSKYPAKVEQGTLYAEVNKTLISVVPVPKFKLICLSVNFGAADQHSVARMKELANEFNYRKRMLRVGIGPKGNSYCTYYIVYEGGLSEKNLHSSLDWFYVLVKAWSEYVYMNGKEE